MKKHVLHIAFLIIIDGIFGDETDKIKTLEVKEDDSVTLNTDITYIQRDDLILWMFITKNTIIAQLYGAANKISFFDGEDGRFRGRLQINNQTGSLTIKNIRIAHSGLYQVEIINSRKVSYMRFNVAVHAPLPVPVITRDTSQCPFTLGNLLRPNCSLLCSVMNVTQVTLSWYKGKSLFSSISVSDLSTTLSLPLDVENADKNTYSCMVKNSTSNQTKHVNITDLCQPCFELGLPFIALICGAVAVLFFLAIAAACVFRKYKKDGWTAGEKFVEQRDGVFYAEKVTAQNGDSVTLKTYNTIGERDDHILWMFGELIYSTKPFVVIAKRNRQKMSIYEGYKGRFRDRLQLDEQTGSLTITNATTTDSGIYKLHTRGKKKICKAFIVIVRAVRENTGNELEGMNLSLLTNESFISSV